MHKDIGDTKALAKLIAASPKTMVLSGAGISTGSGIPDFRSSGGYYEGVNPQTIASVFSWKNNPRQFWSFYKAKWAKLQDAQPNAAHIAIARLQERGLIHYIATQNIDGLHQKAGATDVSELHGTTASLYCVKCNHQYSWQELNNFDEDEAGHPLCSACDNGDRFIKPSVVLFGDNLPSAYDEALWHAKRSKLFICLGTGLEVEPVASLPRKCYRKGYGGDLAIINMSWTTYDSHPSLPQIAKVRLYGDLTKVLPQLVADIDSL